MNTKALKKRTSPEEMRTNKKSKYFRDFYIDIEEYRVLHTRTERARYNRYEYILEGIRVNNIYRIYKLYFKIY